MEITLNSKEINKALVSYVTHQFNLKIDPTHSIQIEYKAGRGENGPTASIIIDEVVSDVSKTEITSVSLRESVEKNNIDVIKVCNREDQSCFTESIEDENVSETINSYATQNVEEEEDEL